MTQPETGEVRFEIRRRPTHRHRRNRLIRRICLVVVLAFFTVGLSGVALQYLSPSLFRHSNASTVPTRQQSLERYLIANQDKVFPQAEARPVYPYSVIPGGVENARELKWIAEHDPVIASHYAGFDYDHARIVRLVLAQTVYVSYRVGKNVYWTRHRVTLNKGETLLTDGKITARTKCGNRVEEVPQQATSSSEPPAAKFEEPIGHGDGTAMHAPPAPFQSALLNRPGVPGFEPGPPSSLYNPFSGGSVIPLAPPVVPIGVCGAPIKKKGAPQAEIELPKNESTKKKKTDPCGEGTATVPEPGTWILFASGLVLILWQARRKVARV